MARTLTRIHNGVSERRIRSGRWMSDAALDRSFAAALDQSNRAIAHPLGDARHAVGDRCAACVCGHGVVWFKCLECMETAATEDECPDCDGTGLVQADDGLIECERCGVREPSACSEHRNGCGNRPH